MARTGGVDPRGETNGAGVSDWRTLVSLRVLTGRGFALEAYLISTLLVALAEMGDRTQLLAIMLAGRYRQPVPILSGILAATLANHALAAVVGFYLAGLLNATWFKYAISLSFIAMAGWALIPDKATEDNAPDKQRFGVFLTTAVTFFVVEMGDKTQVATAALAARFHNMIVVTAGTTTGMMIANIPAVLLGAAVTRVLPIRHLQIGAALVYLGLGIWGLGKTAGWLG